MKTFVVNLARMNNRRAYMERILSQCERIDVEYIEAVDGYLLEPDSCNCLFDLQKFKRDYYRSATLCEIGCTLSHQSCYQQIIQRNLSYALILEDDIILRESLDGWILKLEELLKTSTPTVILLSGCFYYLNKKQLDAGHDLASVYHGLLTHSYALNQAAAKLMIDPRPWYYADDWGMFARRGIQVKGIIPHLVDQDWSGAMNDPLNMKRHIDFMTLKDRITWIVQGVPLRLLRWFGHFEPVCFENNG